MTAESVILDTIAVAASRLALLFRGSLTYKLTAAAMEKLKDFFDESVIWRAAKSHEKTSRLFKESLFFKILQWTADKPVSLVRKAFLPENAAYKTSIAGMLLERLAESLVPLVGLFIFIQSVIPYYRWHNHYAVLMILAVSFLYLVRAAGDRRYSLDFRKIDFAMLLFAVGIVLAAITSLMPASSVRVLVFNAVLFLFVFIVVNLIKEKEELGMLIYFMTASLAVTSLYGIWQYINHIPVDPLLVDINFGGGVGRVFSTMGNPNDFATFLLLTIPFLGAAFFNAKNFIAKAIVLVLAALATANLALTYTRAAWIGFAAAVLIYVLLKDRRLLPLFLLLGVASVPFMPKSVATRLASMGKDTSSRYRINVWLSSLKMLKDYWISGIGLGPEPFRKLFGAYTSVQLPVHSHMLYLEIWLEAGITAIASFMWFIARIIKKGFIFVFRSGDEYLKNIIIAGMASLTGLLVAGLTDYVWFYPRAMNMFWIVAAVVLAALNLAYRQEGCAK